MADNPIWNSLLGGRHSPRSGSYYIAPTHPDFDIDDLFKSYPEDSHPGFDIDDLFKSYPEDSHPDFDIDELFKSYPEDSHPEFDFDDLFKIYPEDSPYYQSYSSLYPPNNGYPPRNDCRSSNPPQRPQDFQNPHAASSQKPRKSSPKKSSKNNSQELHDYHANPANKVVNVPIVFKNSESGHAKKPVAKVLALDKATAALKIQSFFRGYSVRKIRILDKLKLIRDVEAQSKEMRRCVEDAAMVELIRKNERERLKINEGIMALFLKLDGVQGVNAFVRESRKAVNRQVAALQDLVDSISSGGETVSEVISQDQDVPVENVQRASSVPNMESEWEMVAISEKKENYGSGEVEETKNIGISTDEREHLKGVVVEHECRKSLEGMGSEKSPIEDQAMNTKDGSSLETNQQMNKTEEAMVAVEAKVEELETEELYMEDQMMSTNNESSVETSQEMNQTEEEMNANEGSLDMSDSFEREVVSADEKANNIEDIRNEDGATGLIESKAEPLHVPDEGRVEATYVHSPPEKEQVSIAQDYELVSECREGSADSVENLADMDNCPSQLVENLASLKVEHSGDEHGPVECHDCPEHQESPFERTEISEESLVVPDAYVSERQLQGLESNDEKIKVENEDLKKVVAYLCKKTELQSKLIKHLSLRISRLEEEIGKRSL